MSLCCFISTSTACLVSLSAAFFSRSVHGCAAVVLMCSLCWHQVSASTACLVSVLAAFFSRSVRCCVSIVFMCSLCLHQVSTSTAYLVSVLAALFSKNLWHCASVGLMCRLCLHQVSKAVYLCAGCFCMTELGHGSNVAALQTECILDTTTDHWIVNTPDDSAIKW